MYRICVCVYIYMREMLRFKITRQQMLHVNIFGCFNNFFRLLQLNEIGKLFLPFIELQNKYLTSNNADNW